MYGEAVKDASDRFYLPDLLGISFSPQSSTDSHRELNGNYVRSDVQTYRIVHFDELLVDLDDDGMGIHELDPPLHFLRLLPDLESTLERYSFLFLDQVPPEKCGTAFLVFFSMKPSRFCLAISYRTLLSSSTLTFFSSC